MDDVDVNERLARVLDRTGDFRILRRVPTPIPAATSDVGLAAIGLATGVVLDTETTGLGHAAEVIELGMVAFVYDPAFLRVDQVVDVFSALRQPSRPIPADVSRLTGITDAAVAGRTIDADAVRRFVDGASIIVAHNAAFDRPVCERAWPWFCALPWACSLEQVPWRAEGFEGRRLGQLLVERRLFHDGHRALDDCIALLHLLRLPVTLGATPFELMMREAVGVTTRVWAVSTPYAAKAKLKARGYRWASGEGGGMRSWWRNVPEASGEVEVAWLREHAYEDEAAAPLLKRITPRDRFSVREAA